MIGNASGSAIGASFETLAALVRVLADPAKLEELRKELGERATAMDAKAAEVNQLALDAGAVTKRAAERHAELDAREAIIKDKEAAAEAARADIEQKTTALAQYDKDMTDQHAKTQAELDIRRTELNDKAASVQDHVEEATRDRHAELLRRETAAEAREAALQRREAEVAGREGRVSDRELQANKILESAHALAQLSKPA